MTTYLRLMRVRKLGLVCFRKKLLRAERWMRDGLMFFYEFGEAGPSKRIKVGFPLGKKIGRTVAGQHVTIWALMVRMAVAEW